MPEVKHCERCGKLLGVVHSSTKYCIECRLEADRERREKYRKTGKVDKTAYGIETCQYCGKPMRKTSAVQKYHKECRKEAYKLRAESTCGYKHPTKTRKQKPKPDRLSVAYVASLADSMGMPYGQVSLLMAQGKI